MRDPVKSDQRYRSKEHLRAASDFARVYAEKCRRSDSRLVVYVAENQLAWSRLGISVSKRVGNAVRRNYLRRRIREAFRTGRDKLPVGLDIVCVVRPGDAGVEYDYCTGFRGMAVLAARKLHGRGKP